MSLRAAATVSLTGPFSIPGRDAAAGLRAWAAARGVSLDLHDDRGDPRRAADLYGEFSRRAEIVLGPYGSGLTRAAIAAIGDRDAVLWNHGGAAVDRQPGVRVVDVLAPAERYWAGLAETLSSDGVDLARVVVARGTSPFGRRVADGAERSLRARGAVPMCVLDHRRGSAAAIGDQARARGASAVVGGGRVEDDLELGRALAGSGVAVALVVGGIGLAAEGLGDGVVGLIGPAQWWPAGPRPQFSMGPVADYPGAQAIAAGLLAERAIERAGSTEPNEVWLAALSLRTRTFLGPFEIDDSGRQLAHAPLLVRWVAGEGAPRRVLAWSPGEGVC